MMTLCHCVITISSQFAKLSFVFPSQAALKAYMKDIQGSGDFTSQLVLQGLEQKQRAADEAAEKQAEAKQAREAAKQREKIDLELKKKRVKEKAKTTKWHEARSDEGYSYYWHLDTNGKLSQHCIFMCPFTNFILFLLQN